MNDGFNVWISRENNDGATVQLQNFAAITNRSDRKCLLKFFGYNEAKQWNRMGERITKIDRTVLWIII